MDRQGPVTPSDAASATGDTPGKKANITRRRFVQYGLGGLAAATAATGTGLLAHHLVQSIRAEVAADVFRNDAPTGELWALWQKRGWTKEAFHYLKLGRNVRCKLCPNACLLQPEDRGRCRNRINKDGVLYTLAYANPCAFNADPIEKKPMYHFLPATRSFSIATSGCGFRCLNCQNWDISQRKPEETKDPRGAELRLRPQVLRSRKLTRGDTNRLSMFPQDVVQMARELNCASIAYTYSEPTMFFEYMYDTAKAAQEQEIKNVWVTCGYIRPQPLRELCRYLDAANVDLKSFSDDIYHKLNSGKLQPILDTLQTLKEHGVWFEVTNLIVPTYTDKMAMIRRMCDHLAQKVGIDYPLHFSRFHPAHKLTRLPPTPREVLLEARSIAVAAGLRYVYIGNIRGVPDAGTTFCPGCKRPVVARDIYVVLRNQLSGGKCKSCGAEIAGVWSA